MAFTLGRKRAPHDLATCAFRRAEGVLATRQGEELVLLDTLGERYYTLNDVGAVAWNLLAAPVTCAAIVEVIRREFDTSGAPDPTLVERDVTQLVEQLFVTGLVSVESAPAGTAG
jgi:hypothetical protein